MTHPHPTLDHARLRKAFGMFPTGVTIVSSRNKHGDPIGVTINSFSSLSLDPPLLLWSLSKRSKTLPAFQAATHFAINILAEDQLAMSRHFASRVVDKFRDVAVHEGIGGVPLIDDCAAHIECRVHSAQPVGDHLLFIGRIERVQTSERAPLVFFDGRYFGLGGESY